MDEKRGNLLSKNRGLLTLVWMVSLFVLGGLFLSAQEGENITIGTEITAGGLEERWSEEYKLLLPGTIEKININTADQQTLEALPGVGEKIAKAIVSYREEKGLFHSIDEIVHVSGIGVKKRNQMKEFIIVE
ncbi:ComEA family DNA-binding protein [Anaerotignum sp. MB30-C6]|uniref:ComEA family DNA-binding protein n=1 Tax=Anaerotignum sp. MB30-C6 TaxID=3070814 RepID=UPI0027DB73F4|nr:ComEA family DNA-binding protein [Anaerotignum sp. MB30-C6]WMI80182.1 ComEA family DNA-binding protein [Anaerotignum sp. MB30-C6]